jgi:hypothetical protein
MTVLTVYRRVLEREFEHAFTRGVLKPVLEAVRADRDLILECRGKYATVYCKGQSLKIEPSGGGYNIGAHERFECEDYKISTEADAVRFVRSTLPGVKQRMATHAAGMEIEFEQALIRANNKERSLNTDYIAVDRQVMLGGKRLDVIGIHWPSEDHKNAKALTLSLIEVKFGQNLDKLHEQVLCYYDLIAAQFEDFVSAHEELLAQKLRLGLITGCSDEALVKLSKLRISRDMKRFKIAIALVDYNPNGTKNFDALWALPFSDQIEIFKIGFGMWSAYAISKPKARAAGA